MDDRRDSRLETKIDMVVNEITQIKIILGRQNLTLEEHIRRTELLEKDVAPIKHKISMIEGVLKFLGAMALIAGLVELVTRMMTP